MIYKLYNTQEADTVKLKKKSSLSIISSLRKMLSILSMELVGHATVVVNIHHWFDSAKSSSKKIPQ